MKHTKGEAIMKVVPLKYDFCIKEIMENKIVRRHFTSDVLSIPLNTIKSVRMMNTFYGSVFGNRSRAFWTFSLS